MNVDNIVLGTVKLGIPEYGFSNTISINLNPYDFLAKAWNIGVRKLDTSPRYGISEKVIGKFIKKENCKPFISTKIDGLIANNPNVYDIMFNSVRNSLNNLNIECIDLCYLHQNDIKIISDPYILEALTKLKDQGLIKLTGVSIYNSQECRYAIENPLYDFIQFPVNIFDTSLYCEYVKNNQTSKKFVARSIFLQGVIMNQTGLQTKSKYWKEILECLEVIKKSAFCYKISLIELSLLFVFSLLDIEDFIIGTTSINNLKMNVDIINNKLNENLFAEIYQIASKKKKWSNPQLWT